MVPRSPIRRACLAASVPALGAARQEMDPFGDPHFKTPVSPIELHRARHGSSTSPAELEYVGSGDPIALGSVAYRRVGDGYALERVRGWVGPPRRAYPAGFWRGRGIRESNVMKAPPADPGSNRAPRDPRPGGECPGIGRHSLRSHHTARPPLDRSPVCSLS